MIRANFLKPFVIYRTKPPVIMPESQANRKKGQAYVTIAPTVEAGLKFMSTNRVLECRYLTKFFIEKRYDTVLYGQGKQIIKPNSDGEITELLNKYRRGNLRNVEEVTSFLPTTKADVLRGFNLWLEVNHVNELVLQNPKDRRLPKDKAPYLLKELTRAINIDYIGSYQRTIILPLNLWFNATECANASQTIRTISRNVMGALIRHLCVPENLKNFGRVMLIDDNIIMILDANGIPDKGKTDQETYIYKMLLKYFSVAKKVHDGNLGGFDEVLDVDEKDETIAFDTDPEKEEAVPDEKETVEVKKAVEETDTEIRAEKMLDAVKADPDEIPPEQKEKVKKVAKKAAAATPAKNGPTSSTSKTVALPKVVNTEEKTVGQVTMDIPQMNLKEEDADALLAAKMAGKSVASAKRDELLKTKYKDLKFGTTPMKELVEEAEAVQIPPVAVQARTLNPAMKNIKAHRFEEVYKDTLYNRHLVAILTHFGTVSPAMFLNKDIKIDDVSTRTDRILRYTVEFEDENRKRHRFSFLLPKMYKDRYLYLNNQELNITHQKLPFPITKVQPDRCQLVTNYNKIFVYRYGTALSPRIAKLKKVLSGDPGKAVSVTRGNCTILNKSALTTIEFDELASCFTKIKVGTLSDSITFMFEVADAAQLANGSKPPEIEGESGLFVVAIERSKTNGHDIYWLSGTTNRIYNSKGEVKGELSDFLVECLVKYDPTFEKEFAATSAGTKFIYSRARIMAQDLPLILVMAAADPNGLVGVMEKAKVSYQFYEKKPKVDKDTTGVIPFSDGYLLYECYPFENSLLMNGLAVVPTKEYSYYAMASRETYVDIFDLMCGKRTLADNLGSFYYMMVDPITRDVLVRLGMPTDFITLLSFCNGVLVDNSFQIDSNYHNSRIRSTEIIMAHLYRYLAVAWSNVRSGRTPDFSIPENCIIKELLTSKIVDPKSKLNISLELENDRNVKLKGPSGMNEDHSFTIEKRAYHESMRGIVATNSTPSGEVGICRHLSVNANIDDALGFISVGKKDYDGTELMSPAELLSPFSAESADIERLCMSISQAKHLVPVDSQCACPVSFDFERVAPYLSNDFAFVAKKNGKVVEISEDLMIVQYDDGTTADIDLSEHPVKNTDGGFFIINKMDTDLKVGSRFKANQIIATDRKVFNNNDFFGDPTANVGTLARIAFEENGNVYEDSGYITDDFAHRFRTHITKEKRVLLSPYANIKYIAKIGQKVQANDPILAFDDTEDEFSAQLLASITDQMADEDEVIATSAPVITKYTGVIRDIQIVYTVPTSAMTPSLAKIVQDYSKDAAKREKVIHKYMDIRDSNTIVKNSEMSVADSEGRVGGVKIGDGVSITFYIEYDDVAGNGDKGSIGALKFTTNSVVPTELAAFTDFNDEDKIDVYVSAFGAFRRMVADVEKTGILTKVLVEEKRKMKKMFAARVKAELKKAK